MMKVWRDLKVSYKIGIGIGSIVLILGIISYLSYSNIGGIVRNAGEVIGGNKLDALIAQKEVDHLNWVNQVNAVLTDDTVTELNVQMDDHQCEFGKWLYGDGRKEAEQLVPDLAPLLKAIEEPHRKLHESAAAIKENFRQADTTLPTLLLEREIDHLNWASSIRDSLLKNEPLSVETDYRQCALGKWIESEEAKTIVSFGSDEFKKAWDDLLVNHEKLHASALDITAAMAESNDAAKAVFESKTLPILASTLTAIRTLKEEAVSALDGMHKATAIYAETTIPALKETQAILGDIRKTARENIMTDQQMLKMAGSAKAQGTVASMVAIGIGILLTMLIAKSISAPIIRGVNFAKTIASGDLTQKLDVNQKDEVGVLAGSLNQMSENLNHMFTDIVQGTQTLTSSSTELSAISDQMASNSEQTAAKSNDVSAAAEQMSSSMTSVAAATEQTTTNIQMIVSAAEEMTATIQEVAENTANGSETTNMAVSKARDVSKKVEELKQAAGEIHKVTDTISDISEQTNLLALNATIEAARAGEAGKGFSVVAGEIKALAQQTAEATNEISSRISGVQDTTIESVNAIEDIVNIINEINTIVASIATAIEEQSATTQEISNNVSQAALGLSEVNENVNQTSAVASEVTRDISEVSHSTGEMSAGSSQVMTSAGDLSHLAENLTQMVSRFRLN